MSEAEEAGTEGAKRGATQVKGASRAGSDAAEFLPAAKPTGLVETNSASFFLSFFLSKKMQKKLQNSQISPNKKGSICSLGNEFQI